MKYGLSSPQCIVHVHKLSQNYMIRWTEKLQEFRAKTSNFENQIPDPEFTDVHADGLTTAVPVLH